MRGINCSGGNLNKSEVKEIKKSIEKIIKLDHRSKDFEIWLKELSNLIYKYLDINKSEWAISLLPGGSQYNTPKIIKNFTSKDLGIEFADSSLFSEKTQLALSTKLKKVKKKISFLCLNNTLNGEYNGEVINKNKKNMFILDATSCLFNDKMWKQDNVIAVVASSQKFFGLQGITFVCFKRNKVLINKESENNLFNF